MIGADLVVICFRTREVQKLIETVKVRKQMVLIISALQPGFIHVVNDLTGNHVIQKCLSNFGAEENKVHNSTSDQICQLWKEHMEFLHIMATREIKPLHTAMMACLMWETMAVSMFMWPINIYDVNPDHVAVHFLS
jgi:hypothetical protein